MAGLAAGFITSSGLFQSLTAAFQRHTVRYGFVCAAGIYLLLVCQLTSSGDGSRSRSSQLRSRPPRRFAHGSLFYSIVACRSCRLTTEPGFSGALPAPWFALAGLAARSLIIFHSPLVVGGQSRLLAHSFRSVAAGLPVCVMWCFVALFCILLVFTCSALGAVWLGALSLYALRAPSDSTLARLPPACARLCAFTAQRHS